MAVTLYPQTKTIVLVALYLLTTTTALLQLYMTMKTMMVGSSVHDNDNGDD